MAEVDDLMAEVGENLAKGGRWRGRHHFYVVHCAVHMELNEVC